MKLKHVFFCSLLMSTAFVACTNDEFAEINAPVNTNDAIALGEGFTISVGKGADTRAEFDSKLTPFWEKTDKIGAAWYQKVTSYDKETFEVKEVAATGGTFGSLDSNHPFDLTAGAGTNDAEFTTVTNAFAGAYILYYPYDEKWSMTQSEGIPVNIPARQEFDTENGLKQVNGNMFSYCAAKFVPGGHQAGKFMLKQVPVLFNLVFTADEKLNMNLADGIAIDKIVVEASKGNNSVLRTEGLVTPGTTAPTKDNYNADPITLPAEYNAVPTSEVDHFSIDVKNGNKDDYKMLVKGTPTKKSFMFTTLPLSEAADAATIKVITSKGTFAAELTNAKLEAFNKAAKEGEQVKLNVVLDVTVNEPTIYTEAEFIKQWNAANAKKGNSELTVAEDLVIEEALTWNNSGNKVTVKNHKGDRTIEIPSLKVEKGIVDFQTGLEVAGTIETTGYGELTANEISAEKAIMGGKANLTFNEIGEMSIGLSGDVELTGLTKSKIGVITVEKGTGANIGKLSLKNVALNGLTNNGTVTLGAGNSIAANATVTNNGTLNLDNEFTNNGTFVLEKDGTVNGTSKFINAAGATAEFKNYTMMVIENKAADAGKKLAAGVININVPVGADFSTESVVLASGSVNNGVINIVKGTLGAYTLNTTGNIINIYKEGKLHMGNANTPIAGRVIVKDPNATIWNVDNSLVAYEVNKTEDIAKASVQYYADQGQGISALLINGAVEINDANVAKAQTMTLLVNNDITLKTAVTMSSVHFIVEKNAKISGGKTFTVAATDGNKVNDGVILTVDGQGTALEGASGATITLGNNAKVNATNGATVAAGLLKN